MIYSPTRGQDIICAFMTLRVVEMRCGKDRNNYSLKHACVGSPQIKADKTPVLMELSFQCNLIFIQMYASPVAQIVKNLPAMQETWV